MGRKRKLEMIGASAVDAVEAATDAPDDTVSDLIGAAIGDDDLGEEIDAMGAAAESLDAARGEEPELVASEDGQRDQPADARPRRGRKPGSSNRPRATSDATDIPKTKKGALEYAARMKAERDALDARVNGHTKEIDVAAVERLSVALAAGSQMIGSFMASRKGAHWKLDKAESDALGSAWAVCLAPYADTLGDSVPWVIAVGVTYNVFYARIETDRVNAVQLAEVEKISNAGATV